MEDKEIMGKLKACKNIDELKAVGKEIGYELTDEEADSYLKQFNASGELVDDELGNVTGGCAKWRRGSAYSGDSPHYLIVTIGNDCRLLKKRDPSKPWISCPHCVHSFYKSPARYCKVRTFDNDPVNPK